MTDRPIIFSAAMILALLASRKTQTRRKAWGDIATNRQGYVTGLRPSPWQKVQPGDRLWVRENMRVGNETLAYVADNATVPRGSFAWQEWLYQYGEKVIPSIHMPRWASRLTLTVTEVRRQRLQGITEKDAIAEGIAPSPGGMWSGAEGQAATSPIAAFALLWRSLHGAPAWDANPEVIALTFSVERRNIDAKVAA